MAKDDAEADGTGAVEVSAGVIFRDGLLLITRRRAEDHLGGLWEFPGGKRHAGESWEDCLRRELMEELGIEVEVGGLIADIEHEYPEKRVHLKFFRCRWRKHEPRAIGCAEFEWVDREGLAGYDFPAADQQLIERLLSDASLWN